MSLIAQMNESLRALQTAMERKETDAIAEHGIVLLGLGLISLAVIADAQSVLAADVSSRPKAPRDAG